VLATLKSNEFRHVTRYDDVCRDKVTCSFDYDIPKDFNGPFYIYIEFENYFINHRKTSKSFDNQQLNGDARTSDELMTFCEDKYLNEQATHTHSYDGTTVLGIFHE
jgi:hypothetical protein